MAEEKKDVQYDVQYVGNKVKVKVNKSGTARKGRKSGRSAGKISPAQPVSPEMLQPVDYQPPEDDKLKSIREAGFRDGQELSRIESGTAEKEPPQARTEGAKPRGERPDGGYIGQNGHISGRGTGANAEPAAADTKTNNTGKTENIVPDKKSGEANGDENIAAETVVPSQTQTLGKNQRKGRKKKKAEQKAERKAEQKAAERAAAADGAETGEEKTGKTAQKGEDAPQISGQDKLKKSGAKPSKPPLTVPRAVVMALSGMFMLYALSPLALGVVTVGILPPLCIGAFFFIVTYYWPKIRDCRKPWANALFMIGGAAVIAGTTLIFYLFGLMYAASAVKPPANRSDYTVVVLGCKTIDNRPSLMLEDRLNAAAGFLKAHPGAYCIVSGGQGDDEDAPESTVMKRYLVSKGISELRIVEERRSSTTYENIENSCAMLEECNLYDDIVIVTDRFHQYRARHYVEKKGLRCYAVNSETRWYLAIHYWFKEMVAVGLIQIGYEIR